MTLVPAEVDFSTLFAVDAQGAMLRNGLHLSLTASGASELRTHWQATNHETGILMLALATAALDLGGYGSLIPATGTSYPTGTYGAFPSDCWITADGTWPSGLVGQIKTAITNQLGTTANLFSSQRSGPGFLRQPAGGWRVYLGLVGGVPTFTTWVLPESVDRFTKASQIAGADTPDDAYDDRWDFNIYYAPRNHPGFSLGAFALTHTSLNTVSQNVPTIFSAFRALIDTGNAITFRPLTTNEAATVLADGVTLGNTDAGVSLASAVARAAKWKIT